jgi:hypothetical protein
VPPAFHEKQIVCIAKSRALYRKKSTSWDAMSAIGAKRTSAADINCTGLLFDRKRTSIGAKTFYNRWAEFWRLVHAQVGITGGAWSVDRNVPGFN